MKKTFLFLLVMLSALGRIWAQDVYSVGYRMTEDSLKESVIYRNGELLYNSAGTMNQFSNAVCLAPDNNLFWVNNVTNPDGSANYAEIHQNNANWFWTLFDSGTHIHSLYWYNSFDNDPQNNLYAAGCTTNGDTVPYAVVWRGNAPTPLFTPDHGYSIQSAANDVVVSQGDNGNAQVFYCGYVTDTLFQKHATVWHNNEVLFTLSDNYSEAVSLACYHGHVYTLVNEIDTTTLNNVVKVYMDSFVLGSLSDPNYPAEAYQIKVDGGDVYVSGWMNTPDNAVIWKNAIPYSYYSYQYGEAKSLDITADGVFFTAIYESVPCVVMGGEVLYTLDDATELLDVTVSQSCGDGEVRMLPYFEGFEIGETDWNCWTVLDEGSNFDLDGYVAYTTYWQRLGNGNESLPFEGNHCAAHLFHPQIDQEGWLISPRFYLNPNRDFTTLTFQSAERDAIAYFAYESVMISTTGTNPSDFIEVWSPDDYSEEWKEVSIDLSDFQGELVYIAFRYAGVDAHNWLIDNISLEEADYEFCEPVSTYPFIDDFEDEDLSCYYVVDIDQSGNHAYWQLTNDSTFGQGTVLYHPRGEEGVFQEGWCITRPFVLNEGKDYNFAFSSYVFESGDDMGNSVWIAVDTENPSPGDFTTCLWTDSDFVNDWVDVNIDLSSYAGHTVHLAFKYEGTYAHGWCIDNLSIDESEPTFVITVNTNNPQWGYVFGGGTYGMGATCTLGAIPVTGYDFVHWTKEGEVVSTSQTYSFTVTEDATYTAVFEEHIVQYFTINTAVTPVGAGEVTGGGTFADGSTTFLVATPNEGWYFQQWNDGNTENPRMITVTGNATYTAIFAQLEYELTVVANPEVGGTVTGGGLYHYGDVVQLTAVPAQGFEFESWNDGSTLASRVVTVYSAATYIATFVRPGVTYYTVTAEPNDPNLGSVIGSGSYPEGVMITLTAIPKEGARFTQWSDGTLKDVRNLVVTEDITLIAYFESEELYTLNVVSLNPDMGTVTGSGTYQVGTEVIIEAIPNEGCYFDGWDEDNSLENPRTVVVEGDATYSARFKPIEEDYFTLTVIYNPNEGIVLGGGNYAPGTSVTVEAIPNVGYEFANWNDGVTDFVRTVVLNSDLTLQAFFVPTSVGEDAQTTVGVYPNPASNKVFFTGIEAETQVDIYDVAGALVKTAIVSPNQEVPLGDLPPGAYFARVNNTFVKFMLQ